MAFYTNTAGVPADIIYTNFERKKQAKSLVLNLSNPLFSDLVTVGGQMTDDGRQLLFCLPGVAPWAKSGSPSSVFRLLSSVFRSIAPNRLSPDNFSKGILARR